MAWRNLLFDNYGWKLTSLILATVVWFIFRSGGEQGGEQKFELTPKFVVTTSTRDFVAHPLQTLRVPGDQRQFKLTPAAVEITLSGQKAVLRTLEARDILAFVTTPAPDAAVGITNRVKVYAPPGLTVERVIPTHVHVEPVH